MGAASVRPAVLPHLTSTCALLDFFDWQTTVGSRPPSSFLPPRPSYLHPLHFRPSSLDFDSALSCPMAEGLSCQLLASRRAQKAPKGPSLRPPLPCTLPWTARPWDVGAEPVVRR